MLNPNNYANAAPAGVAVLEPLPGPQEERAPLALVPLRRSTVNGRWEGPLAELTLTHTFGYTRAQCDRVLEAVYRFPLPGDAAVRRVVVTFGSVEIISELKERQEAEHDYERARREGRQAALTTRESPDVFTLRVTGLQPDQDVVVETTCLLLAAPEGLGWTLRIPLTTAPRYVRRDERGSRRDAQPLALYRDPGHRFALDLITSGGNISSGTHGLVSSQEDGHRRVRLAAGELIPDRDCVLRWDPAQPADEDLTRPTLQVWTAPSTEDPASTYLAALVTPPLQREGLPVLPREAIVLVDHSGSMGGSKVAAADRAAMHLLGSLQPGDRYNLAVFDHRCRWMHSQPERLDGQTVERAQAFLQAGSDMGGTELGVALEQALAQRTTRGEVSRHILIITDAQVSDDARILALVEGEARQAARRRISVLCIDASPNAYLTHQLAALGGGVARFLSSDPEQADLQGALLEIVEGWALPLATGLRLAVDREGLEGPTGAAALAPSPRQGWSALDLGDLTATRAQWVVGRVPTGGSEPLSIALLAADGSVVPSSAMVVSAAGDLAGALRAVFGAYRVLGLERLLERRLSAAEERRELERLGYGPGAPGEGRQPLYSENQGLARSAVEPLLVAEALRYGLLCSHTGFVAVRQERGVPVEGTVEVGSALPAGWEEMPGSMQLRTMASPMSPRPMANAVQDQGSARRPTLLDRMHKSRPHPGAPLGAAREALREPVEGDADQRQIRYEGRPTIDQRGQCLLLERTCREEGRWRWLTLLLPEGQPLSSISAELRLLLLVDGALVQELVLREVLALGGSVRIALSCGAGQSLQLVLQDPQGAWATAAPLLRVELR
ncbi:MAG: VIT domain-containing protein [Anaerolineae bacterium]|jgi:Ca-activated chloride channel family protein|nr:VWA domain-containing protein [Chloroflexota bacterium]